MEKTYTIDDFLGGLVRLKQAEDGYRATSDAVLLAAAVTAKAGQRILDVGSGTGAVTLCLNARVGGLVLTGVDRDDEMIRLSMENADLNGANVTWVKGEVAPDTLKGALFDHVMTNPPYFTESPEREKQKDAFKEDLPLDQWVDFCIKRLAAKGTLTIIHRAERVPEILKLIQNRLGAIKLIPLWPKWGTKPKRVIIQGILGSKAAFELLPGVVLHNEDGSRTDEIELVMRKGEAL